MTWRNPWTKLPELNKPHFYKSPRFGWLMSAPAPSLGEYPVYLSLGRKWCTKGQIADSAWRPMQLRVVSGSLGFEQVGIHDRQ
jgi:hypothetical protein